MGRASEEPVRKGTIRILAAGFVYEAESDVLGNPDDDYSLPMNDPAVRRQTDRVVYRFRAP